MSKPNKTALRALLDNSAQRTSFTSNEIADLTGEDHAKVKNIIADYELRGVLSAQKSLEPAQGDRSDVAYRISKIDGFVVIGEFAPVFMYWILQRKMALEAARGEPPSTDWREDLRREMAEIKREERSEGPRKRLQ